VNYFFDSSALIKHYVIEQGTNWVSSLMVRGVGHTLLIAQITSVELVSGIERRRRDGQISQRTARAARLLIRRHVTR
jgi:hypothetical protein